MASPTQRKPVRRSTVGLRGHRPAHPSTLVGRPRLYAVLDDATLSPLTLVISHAGTGKTTLLAAWVEHTGEADAHWISAHEHPLLEQHLLEAVGVDAAEAREAAAASRTDPPGSSEWMLSRLEEAVDRGATPRLVVIDDAHLIPTAQLAMVSNILAKRPEVVRLLVASRRDLSLPRFDLEMHGLATTIRGNQMRFVGDESSALVRAHAKTAADSDIQLLESRAGGWAAALVLGARTLAPGPQPGTPLAQTEQPVLDYLLGEVFTTLPKATRQILLSTFGEPMVTATRATVLSGNPDAISLLSELASDGVLVTGYSRSETEEELFSYHPLLIEMLRRRVASVRADAGVATAAHHRAAVHDAAQGDSAAALNEAIAARDPELLAGMLVEHGVELLCAAQEDLVGTALSTLPAGSLDRFPHLLGISAHHRRVIGDMAGAVSFASRAIDADQRLRDSMQETSPLDDALCIDALLLRLWQSRFGWQGSAASIASAREILRSLEGTGDAASGHRAVTVDASRVVWLTIELSTAEIWAGDLVAAAAHVDEAVVRARVIGNTRLLPAALSHRALIELTRGEAQTCAVTAEEAMRFASKAGLSADSFLDRARLALGWSAFLRLDFEEAAQRLRELAESGIASPDLFFSIYATMLRAMVLAESDQLDEARRLLSATPETHGPLPGFLSRALALLRWHCAAAAADVRGMSERATDLADAGFDVEVDLFDALGDMSTDDPQDAVAKLDRLVPMLTASDPVTAAAAASVRVGLLLRMGDAASARDGLTELLSRVAPERLLYSLTPGLVGGPAFMDLLSHESERSDPHPFAATAFDALARYRESPGAQPRSSVIAGARRVEEPISPPPGRPVTKAVAGRTLEASLNGFPVRLTSREADALEQLALGSSYAEIGRALFITENTVKTHLASMYRKLGVDKRSAALRVARRIGLI